MLFPVAVQAVEEEVAGHLFVVRPGRVGQFELPALDGFEHGLFFGLVAADQDDLVVEDVLDLGGGHFQKFGVWTNPWRLPGGRRFRPRSRRGWP